MLKGSDGNPLVSPSRNPGAPRKGMKPASAKAKGRRFQQAIRALIIKHLGVDPADIVSRPMGSPGEDLIIGVETRRVFPYSVEAKNRKSMKEIFEKGMDQAIANTPEGAEPLLVVRTDYRKPVAIVDLEHFLKLVARVARTGEPDGQTD